MPSISNLVTTALLLFLMGCAGGTTSSERLAQARLGCNGDDACSVAKYVELAMNEQRGKDFGAGVKFRGAKADQRVLLVALDVPNKIKNEPVRNGLTIRQQIQAALKTGLCKDGDIEEFYSLGGEIHLITFLPSGAQFSKTIIKSCD